MALYHFIRSIAFKGAGDARTLVSADDPLPVAPSAPSTLITGSRDVIDGPLTLATEPTPCRKVLIQAKRTNTGLASVGEITLTAGQWIEVEIDDLESVNVDTVENGEGFTYLAWV